MAAGVKLVLAGEFSSVSHVVMTVWNIDASSPVGVWLGSYCLLLESMIPISVLAKPGGRGRVEQVVRGAHEVHAVDLGPGLLDLLRVAARPREDQRNLLAPSNPGWTGR